MKKCNYIFDLEGTQDLGLKGFNSRIANVESDSE